METDMNTSQIVSGAIAPSLTITLGAAAIALAGALGCSGPRVVARTAPEIPASITERGEPIYVGRVFPLAGAAQEPTFVYDRHVDGAGARLVSTHVTREARGGTIALAESATHSADYALQEYTLHANQLGQTGTVRVDGDRVTLTLHEGSRQRTAVERQTVPVAVGPTLVGYIVRHLDELRAGRTVPVRMAALDRLETIGFELSAVDAAAGDTRIRMKPSSFLVGLFFPAIHFTFETDTGKLVRIEGRVPPKVQSGDRWKDFDARVEYRFQAASYR
jgi:hypothetical protein